MATFAYTLAVNALNFRQMLSLARGRARLTQDDLAALLSDEVGRKTTGQMVSNWERGFHVPSPRYVAALIKCLRLDGPETWEAWGNAMVHKSSDN